MTEQGKLETLYVVYSLDQAAVMKVLVNKKREQGQSVGFTMKWLTDETIPEFARGLVEDTGNNPDELPREIETQQANLHKRAADDELGFILRAWTKEELRDLDEQVQSTDPQEFLGRIALEK